MYYIFVNVKHVFTLHGIIHVHTVRHECSAQYVIIVLSGADNRYDLSAYTRSMSYLDIANPETETHTRGIDAFFREYLRGNVKWGWYLTPESLQLGIGAFRNLFYF